MTSAGKVALVTGGNRGIGLAIAAGLAQNDVTVLIGSRDLDHGKAAAAKIGHGAQALQLDVTDVASITGAAAQITAAHGRLDVLIQNAAIARVDGAPINFEAQIERGRASIIPLDEVRAIWETNVFGVLAVYQAMLPLLRVRSGSRIINISSGLASLSAHADAKSANSALYGPGYAASKTALNAVTMAMASELRGTGITVSAVAPGFVKTGLNGFAGTDSVDQGAREALRIALCDPPGESGTFTRWDNSPIAW